MNKTLTDQQVHDAITRAEQKVRRMAPFSSMEERRLAFCRALLATQQPEPRAEVKPRKVERHSDMSVLVVFCSTREASVFEKEIRARAGEGQ